MARLISVPGVASLLVVSRAAEIDDLLDHPALERAFAPEGRLLNRLLVGSLNRQMRHQGKVLPAFRAKGDAGRAAGQAGLFRLLDGQADAGSWPSAPVAELARYVVGGRDRRSAEAALAYAIAWPFLGSGPAAPRDDAYKPHGRYLWRLHRRSERARSTASLIGLLYRLTGVGRRARGAIIERLGGDLYGLHAVEITLANAHVILDGMRQIVAAGPGGAVTPRDLAWGAVRTAPRIVVRQWAKKNGNGRWHTRKQDCFSAENW